MKGFIQTKNILGVASLSKLTKRVKQLQHWTHKKEQKQHVLSFMELKKSWTALFQSISAENTFPINEGMLDEETKVLVVSQKLKSIAISMKSKVNQGKNKILPRGATP